MLLPPRERRGEVHFYLAKSLPYGARLVLSFLLMAGGLAIQVVLGSGMVALGLAMVFTGVLLLLTKGYENKVEEKGRPQNWRPSKREDVERIIEINARQKKWDHDAVDITNGRGCLALLGLSALCGLGILVTVLSQGNAGTVPVRQLLLFLNAPLAILPFWVTGVRSILKNDRVVVKADLLLAVDSAFQSSGPRSGEEFQYQLQTVAAQDGSGDIPKDVKAILLFHEGPPEFLGLQMQISINSVQGTDYPYFYCVLVAHPQFGGLPVAPPLPPQETWMRSLFRAAVGPQQFVVECTRENDVDIAVIRQQTTKTSGYHTPPDVSVSLFQFALSEARRLVARQNAPISS